MSTEKSIQANAEFERLKASGDDSPYDEIVRLRSQLIAGQADLIAKNAEIAELRALNVSGKTIGDWHDLERKCFTVLIEALNANQRTTDVRAQLLTTYDMDGCKYCGRCHIAL